MSSPVRVRLHARWAEDDELRDRLRSYAPGRGDRWRELELTLADDYDVLVVFDRPRDLRYDPARTVVVQGEPAPSRARDRPYLEHPREAFRAFYDVERHHSLNVWHVRRAEIEASPDKSKVLSAVVSATASLPRHLARGDFVSRQLPRLSGFDHFGRGSFSSPCHRGPVASKAAALLPYRYTFNAENWREPNYFTEKILDAILCETLCFYDGCPNLELFLDPATYVPVDMSRPDQALAVIEDAIARDEWSARIDAIRAQKQRLLDELHPLELVRKIVAGEPVRWRPDRPALPPLDAVPVHRIEAGVPEAQRAALERIAGGVDRLGLVVDSSVQLTHDAVAVVDALAATARPGDLVVLGGLDLELFRHLACRPLAGGSELRHVVPRGGETVVAYAATPQAARALLRAPGLRPRDVTLLAVRPPVAYAPGPCMRGQAWAADATLLPAPAAATLRRAAESTVAALPRGRRLGAAGIEAVSLAGASLRRGRLRVARAWELCSGAPAGRSSSYPPVS